MQREQYDVVVIGSGPGGYVAAIRAAQLGLKTACIEKRETLGGTCLNVGCIPSKALLQSTEYYDLMQNDAKIHGIECKEIAVNFSQMMERKANIVTGLVNGVAGLFKNNKVSRIQGSARFLDANTLEVNDKENKTELQAKKFILATGSEPIQLPFMPFDEKTIVSSTGILSLDHIPKKLLVIGAGVIGVELASVYKRLGSSVVIIEMLDRICPAMDKAVSKALLQILKKQGLVFNLSSTVKSAKKENNSIIVSYTEADQEKSEEADVVMVAVGRKPYTGGLGLEEIGVLKTQRGEVIVNNNFQTSLKHIFAIGDIIDGPMLAHKASEEGVAVAEIIAGANPNINYLAIPNVIYTHPEVAAVGMTENEALEKGLQLKIGTSYFKGNPRARCSGYTEGFVKIIGEKQSDRLIGLHIIGPHASEMIGEGVLAIVKRATLRKVAYASHAHPTLCEAIKEAALAAIGQPIH